MSWKLCGIFSLAFFMSATGSEYLASQLSSGQMTVCAVLENTTLKCWGNADDGTLPEQWGDQGGEMGTNLPSIDLGVAVHDVAVSTHICAFLTDGTLKCWGKNNKGQLGTGHFTRVPASSAVTVDLGSGRLATQVALGQSHTCAILDDGTLKCWGSNGKGQLGTENLEPIGGQPEQMGDNLTSINLGSGRTARQVVAGDRFTCALLDNGSVKCWGWNNHGQLGLGISNTRWGAEVGQMGEELPPVSLGAGRTAKQISAGTQHVCAILDDDSAKCWGDNSFGQLGQGHTNHIGTDPSQMGDFLNPIDLGETALQISAGESHTCAVLMDQSLKCWGRNSEGQLGLGDQTDRGGVSVEEMTNLPTVDVGTGLTVQSVSCSVTESCVLLNDYSIKCWGSNSYGQLGQGDNVTRGSGAGEMGDALLPVDLSMPTSSSTTATSTSSTSTSSGSLTTSSTATATAVTSTATSSTASTWTATTRTSSSTMQSDTTSSSLSKTSTASTSTSRTASSATTTGTADDAEVVSSIASSSATSTASSTSASSAATSPASGNTEAVTFTSSSSFFTSTSSTSSSIETLSFTSGTSTSTSTFTPTTNDLLGQMPSEDAVVSSSSSSSASTRSRLVITEEEFEALEEERKAEATQAVQELDTAETAAVTELLTEIVLDEPSGAGVLGQGSKETGGGVMKMVAVSPEAVVESGENVTVVGDQGAVRAEVPAEVVQLASQLAGATNATNGSETMILITITELSNNVADKLRSDDARITAQGRRLASSLKTLPINMKLRTAEGEELRISGLNQPIVFMLPIDNDTSDVPYCAFWDEERAIWSTEGVSTLPSTTPGKVLCSTTHLSIFGGVFEVLVGDMAQVLRCSTAFVVFSAEGLLNLFKTEWLWQGPSLVTFSLLLLFALFFLISLHLDRKASRYFPDKDKEAAFWPLKEPDKEVGEEGDVESAQLDEEKRKARCCSGGCQKSIQSGCEWLLWCVGLLFGFENLAEVVKELLPNAAVGVVDRCIEQIHAHKTGTSRDSLHVVGDINKVLAGEDRIDSSEPTHSVQAKRQSLTETEINNQWKWAVDTFLASSWFTRLRLLFPALHPWAENTRISIFTSHTIRTTLIIMKLISAAAAAALFFSSEAETPDSDPECEQPEELWREMVQNVMVGVLTAFLGDAVIFFLFFVQLRQPKPQVEWTDELKEKYRRRWRCRSVVFWSISTVHIGTCVLYCLSFLANVSVEDAAEWLETCAVTLLQDLIILPLLMALVLASLATLAVTCSRKVHRSYWIAEDDRDAPDALDLEGSQCIGFDAPTEDDWFVAQIPRETEDQSDEDSEGPVIVKSVDTDSNAGSLIQETIITEIRV